MTKTLRAILTFTAFALLCGTAFAQTPTATGVDRWVAFGASGTYSRDAAVPGGDVFQIHIEKQDPAGKGWDSGAFVPVPFALRQGERVSVVISARADQPVTVPVTLQAGAPPYASFAVKPIALTPAWQQFTISGTAPSDMAANTQNLALQLGNATGDVFLGPAFWTRGDAVVNAAAANAYEPTSHAEVVRIASQPGITLEGTLRTPQGIGPLPLIVCLAGSGPNPRGAFKLLDDRLIAEGIATFEYDKRGIGKSTGVFDDSIGPVEADAAAVVRALRARPDIDGARIAVCGISQGGVISALVAADDPQVAAVVMFSGPSGGRSKMAGLRRTLMTAGSTPASIDRIAGLLNQWMEARSEKAPAERIAALRAALVEAFTTGSITREMAEGIIASMDTPVVLSMGMVDPAKALARIKVPVLALYGEKDTVVYSAESVPDAKEALKNNPDATVIEIAGATHLFRYESDGPGYPVAIPQVLDLVTHWLVERLHPKTGDVQK